VFEKFLDLGLASLRDHERRCHQGGRVSRQRRYPSDLTDEQWALVEPLLPAPRTGGRLEKHPRRSKDGILYLEGHLEELYGEVRTGRFSTIISCRFDPDTRHILSSERVLPLYRADSRG